MSVAFYLQRRAPVPYIYLGSTNVHSGGYGAGHRLAYLPQSPDSSIGSSSTPGSRQAQRLHVVAIVLPGIFHYIFVISQCATLAFAHGIDQIDHDLDQTDQIDHDLDQTDQIDHDLDQIDQIDHDLDQIDQIDHDPDQIDQIDDDLDQIDQIDHAVDQIDQVDHDLDNLYPNLPLWVVVQDLYSTDPTQETCATVDRSCRFYGSYPAA